MDTVSPDNATLHNRSTWEYLFTDLADPRTSGWFLMSNPLPVFAIVGSYLYFVLKCGPKYMKDKKPYSLKGSLKIYNLFQIAYNLYMFNLGVRMWSNFNWNCQPIDYSYSPDGLQQAWGCYLYFFNKICDLVDTVFFVLRKKDSHISFLHLFHHSIMVITTWFCTKYFPGGHVTMVGFLNTFVHIIMYSYYYLAALGPKVRKYLWWKKYLTKIQMIQFCLAFLHNSQLLFFDCGFPKWTALLTLPNAVFFFYLFNDFYEKSYKNSTSEKEVQAKKR